MLGMRHALEVDAARSRVVRVLRRQGDRFTRLARRAHRDMTPCVVHDLRVLLRRIRAAVWIARRLAPITKFRDLRRKLRLMGRALGARRMLDVLLVDARTYGLDAKALDGRREEAARVVRKLLRAARRAEIEGLLRDARETVDRAKDNVLADALADRARRLEGALERAPAGKQEMHALRVEAKKSRYVLELLGRPSEFVKPLQERLGRAHDLEVLQQHFGGNEKANRAEDRERAAGQRMMKRVVARAVRELAP